MLIFPDGKEEEVKRRGAPSILEGKRLVELGSRLGVNALVSEMMSIRPESMYVESVRIFDPQILVITNVRPDHLEYWGPSSQHAARCFAAAIPERSTVFIPQEEVSSVFHDVARQKRAQIIPVSGMDKDISDQGLEVRQNIGLVYKIAEFLNIERSELLKGMRKAQPDFGSLGVWSLEDKNSGYSWHFISAFAANDPESTRIVMDRLQERSFFSQKKTIGLLNCRDDRCDRTLQWLEALQQGTFPELNRLVVSGGHAAVVRKRLKKSVSMEISLLKHMSAQEMIHFFQVLEPEGAVILGMGNMEGAGKVLVEYWQEQGSFHVL